MKNLIFTLTCLVGFAVQLIGQQVPASQQRSNFISPSEIVNLGVGSPGGNRATFSFDVSYHDIDRVYSTATSNTFGYFVWNLNFNAKINTNPFDDSGNDFIRWGAVLFDSIRDYQTSTSYPLSATTNMTLDSVALLFRHTNTTGLNDTLIITVFEAANVAGGYTFAPGSNGLGITNTVLHRDTFVVNTSITPNTSPTALYRLPIEMVKSNGAPVTIPQGKAFIVQVRYHGPLADLFELADGNRLECGQVANTAASPARILDNSARYYNIVFPPDPPDPADSSLTGVGQLAFPAPYPTNCNEYYFQNLGISAVVTFDDLPVTTTCPGPATGTAGFRPDYNTLACINQSTAYNSQVSFEIPTSITSPLPATINSIRIDSIRNLPCGITYTLDRPNATYNGGEVGCITFNGTTTVPVGAYKLQVFATANTSFGTLPSSDISALGFEYFLRVIANGASTCPTVASGSAGLTANCNVTPLATNPTATNPTICRGASTTLNANATGGTGTYTYSWSPSTGLSSTTVASPTANPTATTTYNVTVTSGANTATGSVTVTVNAPPSATITGNTTICSGGSTTLSAPAGLTYQWSANAGSSTSQTVTVNAAGTYSVTTTQNGCTATSSVNVTVGNPTATITPGGPTTFCAGGSVTLSAPAGYTYQWSANAGSSTNQTVTATATGTYSVTVSAGAGCTATSSVNVTVNPAPSATITPSGPTTFCTGGSVTLNAPAGLSYTWSNNATTQSIVATQAGTYSVTTTQNGCTATSSVNVTVNSGPTGNITPSGPTTFCTGGSVTLTAPAGTTYQWSAAAGNSTNQTVTATTSGTYSVTVSNGSCTATSSVTVSVVGSPSATITPNGPTTFCSGSSLTLSAPSGYNYQWSANAGSVTTQTVDVTQAGTYSVTVSAGPTCTATSSITVSVNNAPTVTISAGGPTTFCTGGSVVLTSSSGQSYLWSNGSTQSSITATQGGNYSVTVTSANGCTGTAQTTVTVVSTPSATITPSGATALCPGSSVTLSAPSGYSYAWSNGAITESITVQLAGNYSVTVSAGASCTATSSIAVTALTAPDATVTPAGPVTICAGDNVTLSAPAGLLYSWSNGATSQSITPTLAGTYTVTVTNANGCSATSNAVVVTSANPPAKPTATFSNGTLSTTATATTYEWYLNGSVVGTGQSYNPTQNGNYTVVVTDASGCSNQSDPVQVTSIGITMVNTLEVTVQPNPSTGIFNISTGSLNGTFTITIMDIAGKVVLTETVNGQLQQYPVDLSLMGDGVYILRLSNGKAISHSRLIVY